MKRSEMLKILSDKFNRYESGENIAAIALSCVEDNGMLPPEIFIDEEDMDESVHTISYDGGIYAWDKE